METKSNLLEDHKTDAIDRKYQFWERGSYSSTMYSRHVLEQKLDYIHMNPLQERWSLCQRPEEYHYSSAKYYLQNVDNWRFITHYKKHI